MTETAEIYQDLSRLQNKCNDMIAELQKIKDRICVCKMDYRAGKESHRSACEGYAQYNDKMRLVFIRVTEREKLIAAAPDLLESLKTAVRHLECSDANRPEIVAPCLTLCRAAIAKATE